MRSARASAPVAQRLAFAAIAGYLLLALQSATAQSQKPESSPLFRLSGKVIDATDSAAVGNVNVQLEGSEFVTRTNGRGVFDLRSVPQGRYHLLARAFGYAPLKREIAVDSDSLHIDIALERLPRMLSTVTVQERSWRVPRGFEEIYRRGARGTGAFIWREQIDSLNPLDLKTVLQTIPGIHVNDRTVQFHRCYGSRVLWGERPELWVDGQRVTRFDEINEYIKSIVPSDVQAIEVYTSVGRIPAEFLAGGSPCAVIAVWRKRGP